MQALPVGSLEQREVTHFMQTDRSNGQGSHRFPDVGSVVWIFNGNVVDQQSPTSLGSTPAMARNSLTSPVSTRFFQVQYLYQERAMHGYVTSRIV